MGDIAERSFHVRNSSWSLHSDSIENSPEESEMPVDEDEFFRIKDLEKKLETVKKEKLEKNLLKKSIGFICVRSFLSKYVVPSLQETNHHYRYSKRAIRPMNQLLDRDSLNSIALTICEENRNLEKEIREKKLHLKDLAMKRKRCWNDAVKVYMLSLEKVTELEHLQNSTLSVSGFKSNESQKFLEYRYRFKIWSMKNVEKSYRILQLSRILNNLVCFSGKPWAADKNLSQIIFCTGNILGNNFGTQSPDEKRIALEDLAHRLNCVKL